MEEKDKKKYRKNLLAKKNELLQVTKEGEDAAGTVELDQSTVGRISRMGAMQSQAMSIEGKNRRKAELQQIENALEKLEKGTYGLCIYCDKEIAPPRLEFDPSILTCINCANRS